MKGSGKDYNAGDTIALFEGVSKAAPKEIRGLLSRITSKAGLRSTFGQIMSDPDTAPLIAKLRERSWPGLAGKGLESFDMLEGYLYTLGEKYAKEHPEDFATRATGAKAAIMQAMEEFVQSGGDKASGSFTAMIVALRSSEIEANWRQGNTLAGHWNNLCTMGADPNLLDQTASRLRENRIADTHIGSTAAYYALSDYDVLLDPKK